MFTILWSILLDRQDVFMSHDHMYPYCFYDTRVYFTRQVVVGVIFTCSSRAADIEQVTEELQTEFIISYK